MEFLAAEGVTVCKVSYFFLFCKVQIPSSMKILSSFIQLFQTCVNYFLLLNIKEYIIKNMDNQRFDGLHWLP